MDNKQINIEKQFFARVAQGDEEACNTLFHAYVLRLRMLITKVTRTEAKAGAVFLHLHTLSKY